MIISSEYTAVASAAVMEDLARYNATKVRVGVRFYNFSAGSYNEVEPSAGSFDVLVRMPTIRDFKDVGDITANDKTADVLFEGPVIGLKVAPKVAIAGATHYKVVVVTV